MRIFIDGPARTAHLFADNPGDEMSLLTIFEHLRGPLPNNAVLSASTMQDGNPIPMHISLLDQSARAGGK